MSAALFTIPALIVDPAAGPLVGFLQQLSPAEAAVVILYTAVLAVLSVYGLHRSALAALYLRRRNAPPPLPRRRFDRLPRVTIQLPLYNERLVVDELIEAACRIDYPRERLQIQVLDDSTDETTQLAAAAVERFAARGCPIEFLHRDNRVGYKAGALDAGLRSATGEIVAVFDADFTPPRDFLNRLVHHFTDPAVGAVQARWTFRNRSQSLLCRVQAMLLDGHFFLEHGARARNGLFFNFNGTAGLLRRTMIEDAGGWQHDTLTEDTDLSYRAQARGWKFVYRPDVEAPSELPEEMASFQRQQARWAKGLTQTAIKLLPRLLRSRLPLRVKTEAFFHLTGSISFPLMGLLALLIVPAALIRFEHREPWLLLIDVPIFLATFCSIAGFYLLAQRERDPQGWTSAIKLVPALLAVGVGLTVSNARAVLEALAGAGGPFERTAKNGGFSTRAKPKSGLYSCSAGRLPWANLLGAGVLFLGGCNLAAAGAWAVLPFVALFVAGFGYAGALVLLQARGGPEATPFVAAGPD